MTDSSSHPTAPRSSFVWLDGLPDPVLVIDRAGRVAQANRRAHELLGSGLPGRPLALVLRDPSAVEAVNAVFAGQPAQSATLTWTTPVERVFDLHVAATADPAAPMILVLQDVTRIRQAERMRADFVANVSHELRSPLAAIIGIIETLSDSARDDAEAREHFLTIMQREADRMRRLIGDLLSLSRIEVDEHVPPRSRVDLATLTRQCTELLAPRAAEQGMRLTLDVDAGLADIPGDADQLTQVVQNLIDNAIKYGEFGTAIAVRLAAGPDPSQITLSVANVGEGIPPEDLPRLTERFYRVDKARSRNLGGTGLGLAIVKHIVNRHRGKLEIASSLGQGTTVTVHLPLS
ncbi:MAG: PAS domain-containing protein [Rhodospirillales bacterium]|nr:PAS domain-containing protein [Rhodospirillales bacterium]